MQEEISFHQTEIIPSKTDEFEKKKKNLSVGEMAQQGKAHEPNPDDLSSILNQYGREDRQRQVVLPPPPLTHTQCWILSSEDSTIHQKCGWRKGRKDETVGETQRHTETAQERCGG